jgi:polyphosphate kinase 2 (PPK2 family)
MLDQIDLDRAIDKREYKERLRALRPKLYDMQQALFEARRPALIVFEGWASTTKIGTISLLTSRLDPRGLRVLPITPPRTSETRLPWLYRFWLKIPSYGQVAIFDRSWYRQVIAERTQGDLSGKQWRARCEDIGSFERQIADDGTIILKFWLHIARKEQARRFRKLERDPLTAWQVTDEDRWQNRHYRRVRAAVEDLIARTDTPYAPWVILPATNKRYARVATFEAIVAALEASLGLAAQRWGSEEETFDASGASLRRGLAAVQVGGAALPAQQASVATLKPGEANGVGAPRATAATVPPVALAQRQPAPGILGRVDLSLALDPKTYARELAELQAKLHLLGFQMYLQKRPVVLVLEGWDAAGKGGAIKRLTEKLDPRGYVVHTIAAPAGDDKAHHYLYRFWRRLPPRGNMAIFDRSWYGRVLVERIEGFARPDEWQRAYAEINEFERQLIEFGTIVGKFWLHISPAEQLRRFEERQSTAYKAWKLTDEDWRNREKWPLYEQAADEMLLRTSTPAAPWTIVEAEDKRYARIKVLRTVVRRLEDELGRVKL